MTDVLYLEDMTEGRRFESGEHVLDAASIKAFASEFDPQPFHTDEQAAESTFFGGLAASGWHTAAVTMKLLVRTIPIAGGLVGAGVELSWPTPSRPGDRLRIVSTVQKSTPSKSRPDRGSVIVVTETLNQRGETAQRTVARMIVPRRPTAPD